MMSTLVNCPSCERKLKVPDKLLGKDVKCASCGNIFTAGGDIPVEAVPVSPCASNAGRSGQQQLDTEEDDYEHDRDQNRRPSVGSASKFCFECGEKIRERAEMCPHCGVRQPHRSSRPNDIDPNVRRESGNKIGAGICGILLGYLGIHKFILGMTTPGLIMLLVSLLTCGVGAGVMWVIGLVEGIIYLTKSDEDFYEIYIVGKKEWF